MAQSLPTPILFVHHRSELGGAPTSLSYLLQNLDRTAFAPYVYCPEGPAADLFRAAGATVWTGPVAGFTHIWASVYSGRRWVLLGREALRLLPHLVAFWLVLRRRPFALVHLNDAPLLPAGLLARLRGIPIVWHLRSALPPDEGRRSRAIRFAIRRLAARSIAINEDVATSYAVGSEVIPNSVELDRFAPGDETSERTALQLDPDLPAVTFFGYLYPSKGFREFIEAAGVLHSRGIPAQYLMVGGAVRDDAFFRRPLGRAISLLGLARNHEADARELVRQSDLEDVVRFIPFTRDTATLYRASSVVVAPSRGPELGRPVIEAAACGVPVVATGSRSGGGVVRQGETGLLVDHLQGDALADAIGSLLRDPAFRHEIGAAARVLAEERFDPLTNARRVESIFLSLLAGPDTVRVLYVHHRPQLGGAPSSLALLIGNLGPRFEPHVYTPAGPAAELFASVGARVHIGPPAIFAHSWDRPYKGVLWLLLLRELALLPAHLLSLGRLLRRNHFEIVHLNDSPLLAAAWSAKRHGSLVVWHLRSALAGNGLDRRSRLIIRLIDRWGNAVIAIDSDVAARFRTRLRPSIVRNAVGYPDMSTAAGARARLRLPEDRVLIGYAGFLRRPKGWPELVEAARLLIAASPTAHFVIVGGGVRSPEWFGSPLGRLLKAAGVLADEESEIREHVERASLADHFTFLPFFGDMTDIYQSVDIIAFPNQGVGLGRPVLEAAGYGKPVVASGSADGAGILIPGVTGLLLDEPTPANLAAALRRLVDDPELRATMGEAALAHAHDAFDAVRNASKVVETYDALLEGRTARRAHATAAARR